ncbi:MAG: hypothetical protein ACK5ZE_12665 [Pseudanabaena sp.]
MVYFLEGRSLFVGDWIGDRWLIYFLEGRSMFVWIGDRCLVDFF